VVSGRCGGSRLRLVWTAGNGRYGGTRLSGEWWSARRRGAVWQVRRGSPVSPRLGEAGMARRKEVVGIGHVLAGEARLGHTRSGTNWSGWAGEALRGVDRRGR
jgi:hypothetical protein